MANNVIYALIGGILPALIWLIFWLREDRKNPEPRLFIMRTFLLGMGGVLVITLGALIFEDKASEITKNMTFTAIVWLALTEEILKFVAAYVGGLRSTEDNEPIDSIVYMITAALGFVALENTLFILGPLMEGEVIQSLITGHMRFIGASLLHVVSSGIIGVALAFSFYKSGFSKFAIGIIALIGAVVFHTFFNTAIIIFEKSGTTLASVSVWVGVIFLLWAFEKSKAIAR